MAGKVLDIDAFLTTDLLGERISYYYIQWETFRTEKRRYWDELRQYVYAVDTKQTQNAQLPWKNTTTVPKLCQIRDNLYANYMASMFPKRKWLIWEADDNDSNAKDKSEAIRNYMSYVLANPSFKTTVEKLVLDYIDYGNCFAIPEWCDETQMLPDGTTKVGYIGPALRRVSPLDIVFNPIAPTFESTPKIVRSLISRGECKELLERFGKDGKEKEYKELWEYMEGIRRGAQNFTNWTEKSKNDYYRVDGFTSFTNYLMSDYVELLTFYGDVYDKDSDEFLKDHVIVIADRHKIIHKAPQESYFGHAPIFHCGWRVRQDNLWAMGPLDNLVGMQYRIDHIENLKADVFDLIAFPPLKVKGYVEDFDWGPFERIYVGDDGDVSPIMLPYQVLEANKEIQVLQQTMEEMAGSPKEAMGFRTPGEKTAYEVQRLENAASRVFQNKIAQFEEKLVETSLNGMLELARRNMNPLSIRVFDDEMKMATFLKLSPTDITGNGRIRPIAARHFAERAELVQNLNNFFNSPLGQAQDVRVHFSGLKLAKLFEELLDIRDYEIVLPYVGLSEQADAQRLAQTHQENVAMEGQTPAGISPDDYDHGVTSAPPRTASKPAGGPPQAAPLGTPPPMVKR